MENKIIHGVFFSCLAHNMEFITGNCDSWEMICKITESVDFLLNVNSPLTNDRKIAICNMYEDYVKKLSHKGEDEKCEIVKSSVFNAFSALFLSVIDAYKITEIKISEQKNEKTKSPSYKQETINDFIDYAINKKKLYFDKPLTGDVYTLIGKPQDIIYEDGTISRNSRAMDQLFYTACRIYLPNNKTKPIVLRLTQSRQNPKVLFYFYADDRRDVEGIYYKIRAYYNWYMTVINKGFDLKKIKLQLWYDDARFVCLAYMTYSWLGHDVNSMKNPFNYNTGIRADQHELWNILVAMNDKLDTDEEKPNRNMFKDISVRWTSSNDDFFRKMLDAYLTDDNGEALINYMLKLNLEHNWPTDKILEYLEAVIDEAEEIIGESEN